MQEHKEVHVTEYILILIAVLSVLAIILTYDITGNTVALFVRVAPGIQLSTNNITFQQNASMTGNLSTTTLYFYSPSNTTVEFNLSIPGSTVLTTINLTIIANTSRDMLSLESGVAVSPVTAKISNVTFNLTSNIITLVLNETNANFTNKDQEVFLVVSNRTVKINLAIGNETRKLAIFDQYMVSPKNATIEAMNFSQNALRTKLSGNGSQEIVIYIGSQQEPSSIVIDGNTTLTNSNWIYNPTEKTVRFNMSFSERDVVLNFPTTTTTTITPSAAPSGGGGGGSGVSASALVENFTVEGDIISVVMMPGQEETDYVTIKNTGNKKLDIFIGSEMRNIFIEESKISLLPGEAKKLGIKIFAPSTQKPGIYPGRISLSSDSITRYVDVVMELKERAPLFDVSVSVLPESKNIEPGKRVSALVSIENVLYEGIIDVELHTSIVDFDKNVIQEKKSIVAFVTKFSTYVEMAVPEKLPPGKYIFVATVSFLNTSTSSFDTFTVKAPAVVEERIRNDFYTITVIAAIMILSAIMLVLYEHTKVIGLIHMHYHGGHGNKVQKNKLFRHLVWNQGSKVVRFIVGHKEKLSKSDLKKQQDKLVHRLEILKQSYKEGVIDKDEYVKKLKDTEQRIKQVHAKLKKLEEESIEYSEEEVAIFRKKKQEYESDLRGLKNAYEKGAINKSEYERTKETLIKKIKNLREQLNQ